jgi:hypothetical protein
VFWYISWKLDTRKDEIMTNFIIDEIRTLYEYNYWSEKEHFVSLFPQYKDVPHEQLFLSVENTGNSTIKSHIFYTIFKIGSVYGFAEPIKEDYEKVK